MTDSNQQRKFYGKYRGQVVNNEDPLMLGRIRAKVPAIFSDNDSGWAFPCVPYAGKGVGFFFIPPIGANVWIEFEGGNPEHPIWSGCFWSAGEAPEMPAVPEIKVIKTDSATITMNDASSIGGVTIVTATGMKIVMDIKGIELCNGSASVKLTPVSVSINDGALEVI
jgi:hypothetical protein